MLHSNSVIIPESKSTKSHFHILCYLKGHHRTTKVAAMVDSGATSLFIDHKYAGSHKMLKELLKYPITVAGPFMTIGSIFWHQVWAHP